jgi:hypothetical protein
MTAAQDLAQDPTGFMDDNIVVVPMTGNIGAPLLNGPIQVVLYSRPLNRVRGQRNNFSKSDVDVYFMAPPGAPGMLPQDAIIDANQLTVYFCPYDANNTLGVVVSNAADLMFTTQMDGCSVGIGNKTSTGDRLIYHSNQAALGRTGPNAQLNAQDQALRTAFTTDQPNIETKNIGAVLSPVDYRESSRGTVYNSTTFGVRSGGNWNFYAQRYREAVGIATCRMFVLKEVIVVL